MSAGQDVHLECEVAEAGEVVWLKGTERIQPSGRFQVLCQGQRQTLVIRGFSAEDQGEYRCGPTRDPASVTASAFQGASSQAQLVAGWGTDWGALGYGVGGGPPLQEVNLGTPTSHQGRLSLLGRCTDPVCLSFMSESVQLNTQVTPLSEWVPDRRSPWYPLLVP